MREALQRAWLRRGPLALLLWPLSLFYTLIVTLRRAAFRRGWMASHALPVPVVVVGNVVAGGAGKTPVVIALVRHLQQSGLRPGVVSRGYGRGTVGCREVHAHDDAVDTGDEPLLIARTTGAPVFVASRRVEAAQALLLAHPEVNVLVSDDGLQHLALRRDVDICVFDRRGTGNGFLLPAGPLREPWNGTADLVLYDAALPLPMPGFAMQRQLAEHGLAASGQVTPLADLVGQRLTAVAGIAQPEVFFDMLRARGLVLEKTFALPDHFNYAGWHPPAGSGLLLCTEKDAAKLWPHDATALAVPLVVAIDPAFWPAFDARLSSAHGHKTA